MNLQRVAAAWAILMALALAAVKLAGSSMPLALFALFAAVWLFGAAMLWWFPAFGAAGTMLWGIFLASALVRMHGAGPLNGALAVGFLVGAILAAGVLAQRIRARRSAA